MVVLWQYVVIVQPARILSASSGTRIIKNCPSSLRALRSYGHGFTKQCKKKNDNWINNTASYFILWNHIRKIICKGYYLLFHLCLATSAGNELMTIKNLPFRLRSIAKPDIASQNVMKIVVMKIQAFLERLHLGQCDVAKMWGHTPFIQNINFSPSPPSL